MCVKRIVFRHTPNKNEIYWWGKSISSDHFSQPRRLKYQNGVSAEASINPIASG